MFKFLSDCVNASEVCLDKTQHKCNKIGVGHNLRSVCSFSHAFACVACCLPYVRWPVSTVPPKGTVKMLNLAM